MLERVSALASAKPYVSAVLNIAERPGFTLTQVAGLGGDFEARLSAVVGALPEKVSHAQVNGDRTLFRIGPAQFWIVGPETDDVAARLGGQCAVTPLTSSRVRIAIEGAPAREVLAMLAPVDFHAWFGGPHRHPPHARHHPLHGREWLRRLRHAHLRARCVGCHHRCGPALRRYSVSGTSPGLRALARGQAAQ